MPPHLTHPQTYRPARPDGLRRPGHGPGRRTGRRRRVMAALAMVLALTGCGLRLETDPPPPLVPDTAEEARQRAVADALTLAAVARDARPADAADAGTGEEAPTTGAQLLPLVVEASAAHVTALGGVYDPGTDDPHGAADDPAATDDAPTGDADGPGRSSPEPGATGVGDVVDLLRDTAATSRADALTVEDGGLARLLASVAVHRAVLADRLGGPAPVDDATAESDEARADDEAVQGATEDEDVSAEDDASSSATTADRDTLIALIRAQDAAAQAWEVAAARATDDARTHASTRATSHRENAEQWARAAGLVGPDDPRHAEYAMAPGLLDGTSTAEVLAEAERDLAARYLALVAAEGADTGGRARLLDAAVDAVGAAFALDDTLEPLPGMPEQQA